MPKCLEINKRDDVHIQYNTSNQTNILRCKIGYVKHQHVRRLLTPLSPVGHRYTPPFAASRLNLSLPLNYPKLAKITIFFR
jgi:hypothetical protein